MRRRVHVLWGPHDGLEVKPDDERDGWAQVGGYWLPIVSVRVGSTYQERAMWDKRQEEAP